MADMASIPLPQLCPARDSVAHYASLFPCQRACKVVRIALTIHADPQAPHVSGACEGAEACGVATRDSSGEFLAYDWTRCIHPRLHPDMVRGS